MALANDPCYLHIKMSDADRELRFTQETGKSDRDYILTGYWYRITGKAGHKLANRYKQN